MTPEQKKARDEEWFDRAQVAIFAPSAILELDSDKLRWPLPLFDRMPDIMGGDHSMSVIRNQYTYGRTGPLVRWSPPLPPINFLAAVSPLPDSPTTSMTTVVDFRMARVNRPRGNWSPEESFIVEFASERDQEVFITEMKRLIDIKRRDKLGIY